MSDLNPNRAANGQFDRKIFDDRIVELSMPEPNSGCLIWMGALCAQGYALINIDGQNEYAHILCYERKNGVTPDDLELDHKCRVRCCINDLHLEPVTHKVNVLRGESPPAQNARKTHCKRGHPLSGGNLYTFRRVRGPERSCKICHNKRRHGPVGRG